MPNTGKPSKDCHLCRQRRVKCDLARPACQRCTKYGAECPGYRDQQELVFRNADPTTVKRRKKRQAQTATSPNEQEAAPKEKALPPKTRTRTASPTSSYLSTPDPHPHPDADFLLTGALSNDDFENDYDPEGDFGSNLVLSRSLQQHWTLQSVPIVMNVYDNLDFIQNIYRENHSDGPLIWAAHLFSRTYVTNLRYPTAMFKESHAETQKELGTYLGKTLSAVSAALKEPDGINRDDVLATVWLLAHYELLMGSLRRMEPLSPWHLHARGVYSILKSRGTAPLYTAAGRTSFWPAYNLVQIQCLITSTECPPETDEWFDIIENSLYPGEGMTLYISRFINTAASIQARTLAILRSRDFPAASSEFLTLFNGMNDAHQSLNAWIELNLETHKMDMYMRNVQFSACVKGYHIMQLLINFLTHYAPCPVSLGELRQYRVQCLQEVQIAAQGILDNVPRCLGPLAKGRDKSPRALFDALKIVWPLISIFIIPSARPEQRLAAEGILVYIGKELGVRQALNTYPGTMLLPAEAQEPLGEEIKYHDGDCFH